MLSFTLPDNFIESYADRPVEWGFTDAGGNSLGEITFIRTYSRIKEDGSKERWHETCRRVIEGMFSIQKDWAKTNRLPWNDNKAQKTAQDAYERLFSFKWTPPGRGLWMMGTPLVNEQRNSAALQNCAFVSTADMTRNDPAQPLCFLMEASMLGVGVGFDAKGADREFEIHSPEGDTEVYVIPDTREGWVESVRLLINSFLVAGKHPVDFDYSEIRPAGEPIKTFGGTAAGPDPLIRLHAEIRNIFDGRQGELLTRSDIADLGNLIGVCVVSGNVRRSAELLIGSIEDPEFLDLKNFGQLDPETYEYLTEGPAYYRRNWGWMSNNSVEVHVGQDLTPVIDGIKRNGEPGVIWMDVSRQYGRLIDPPTNADSRVMGYNPCLTEDTWVMTTEGPHQIRELIGKPFAALVDGKPFATLSRGFWLTGTDREVFDLVTEQGYTVRLTDNHQVFTAERGWVEAGKLLAGEKIRLHEHIANTWGGRGSQNEGYLLGHLWGDGTLVGNKAVLSLWGDQEHLRNYIQNMAETLPHRLDWTGFNYVKSRDEWRLNSVSIASLAATFGMVRGNKKITDEVEKTSSEFYRGFLRAAFDTDGSVEGSLSKGVSIRLHQSDKEQLERVQRMLARLGILSSIYSTRPTRISSMPDGHGNMADYISQSSWRLVITGEDAFDFMDQIGFADQNKTKKWEEINLGRKRAVNARKSYATFVELVPAGRADVYDVTIEDVHAFDANGLYVHNCAEQSLESHEMCTLVEVFLNRHEDIEDYKKTLKVAFMYAKTVTLLPTHWDKTNAIMQRNRRIGTSVSGIANFADTQGMTELRNWLNSGYSVIRYYDKTYSEWLGVRESVKVTTVKPSGTVSILAGESPGVHWSPGGEYFLRAMRLRANDPLVSALEKANYTLEPDITDPEGTIVAYFPIHSKAKRSEKDVTIFEKANLAVLAQRYWSDNSVSVTVSFDPDTEADHVGTLLHMHDGQLKTISFLPMLKGAYVQMPYGTLEKDAYEASESILSRVDMSALYEGEKIEDAAGEAFCTTDVCIVELPTPEAIQEVVA